MRALSLPLFVFVCVFPRPGSVRAGEEEGRAPLDEAVWRILEERDDITVRGDEELRAAAREAAEGIAAKGPGASGDRASVSVIVEAALRSAGVTDKKLFPLVIVADGPEALLESLSEYLEEEGAAGMDGGSVGIHALSAGGKSVCVILCAERVVRIGPVPGRIAKPSAYLLEGKILEQVEHLHVVVQTPGLEFLSPTVQIEGKDFSVVLPFQGEKGCYAVEILGDTGYGPSILNLFRVAVGADEAACGESFLDQILPGPAGDEPEGKNRAWALFNAVNALRREHGLPGLKVSGALAGSALAHCRDMRKHGFFGHTSPSAGSLAERIENAGVHASFVGEILTEAPGPRRAFLDLASSPSHLAQMLGEEYSHMGIAVVGSEERYFFTAVLALL